MEDKANQGGSKTKGRPGLITIVTAVLSLVSAMAVALIGYQSIVLQTEITRSIEQDKLALEQAKLEFQKEIDRLNTDIAQEELALEKARLELEIEIDRLNASMGQEELALEKQRFEAEQRLRRDGIVKEYVPRLLSSDGAERQTAVAVLFVIYPNEAKDILAQVTEALNEEQAEPFELLIEQATQLDEKTGDWAVAISSDPGLEGTEWEVDVAAGYGYESVVYLRGNWYVTTIGPFATETEAESAKITVRSSFPGGDYRQSAYVVNLNSWCTQPVERDGYFECQNQ